MGNRMTTRNGERTHFGIDVHKHNGAARFVTARYEVSEKHSEPNFHISWIAVSRWITIIGPPHFGQNQPEGAEARSVEEITDDIRSNCLDCSSNAERWAFAMKPK